MKNFQGNISIRSRLIISFSLVVLLALIACLYSINKLNRISTDAENIYIQSTILQTKQHRIMSTAKDMERLYDEMYFYVDDANRLQYSKHFKQNALSIDSLFKEAEYLKSQSVDSLIYYGKLLSDWVQISEKVFGVESTNNPDFFQKNREKCIIAGHKFEWHIESWVEQNNAQMKKVVESIKKTSNKTFYFMTAFMICIFLLGIIITTMTIVSILSPLKNITKSLNIITTNSLYSKLDIYRKDEMGDLANAVRALQETLSARAEKEKQQSEYRNWLKNGQTGLFEQMRGDLTVSTLGDNIITFICKYLKLQAGTIFMYFEKTRHLIRIGAYGVAAEQRSEYFKLGNGLIGQAAADKKMLICPDVKKSYFSLKSSMMELTPGNIYVVPCLYEDKVSCVFEVAGMNKLTDIELEFLNIITEDIAVFLNTTMLRTRHSKMKRNKVL